MKAEKDVDDGTERTFIKHIKNHKFPFNYLLLSTNCGIIQFRFSSLLSFFSIFFSFFFKVNICSPHENLLSFFVLQSVRGLRDVKFFLKETSLLNET